MFRAKISFGLLFAGFFFTMPAFAQIGSVIIHVTQKPAPSFIPDLALGAGVDGLDQGAVAEVYTPHNLRAMRSAGLLPLTYRLRTELGVEAWHWNLHGTWSEKGTQGYWTSRADSIRPLTLGYGYKLPRRGDTIDQANNDGYSRIDDGDTRSFWKSDPYLDKHFTGEDNAQHPQWVLINLGRMQPINAIQIAWAIPFAVRYQVQYWQGENSASSDKKSIDDTFGDGTWRTFTGGVVNHGSGSETPLALCKKAINTRYVRIWMTQGGGGVRTESDVRAGLGYAINEIALGIMDKRGRLRDWIHHVPNGQHQTVIFTSSTDPWHRAADCDPRVEQPGFDRIFTSTLTNGLPLLIPAGLLYDTPDNAVAELKFLRKRGYRVPRMELGEEPDGQYCSPEDYGALYVQWAKALHRIDPALQLGGPSFQTAIDGWVTWPDARGNRSWLNRFLNYLKRRGRLADFAFFSLEWYPFDNICAPPAPQLALAPSLLQNSLARLQSEGLTRNIPWIISEYGYSAFAGQAEMEMPGALLNAEIAAQFLSLGGSAAYVYGYEPDEPIKEKDGCDSWGNLTLLLADDDRQSDKPLPTYYAARLLTQQWAMPGSALPHFPYTADSNIRNRLGLASVTAYALYRPDGQWAVLLLNKDPKLAHRVTVRFQQVGKPVKSFVNPTDLYQYGPAQYRWHPSEAHGLPSPDLPPMHMIIDGKDIVLPPYSLSIVRGRVKNLP